MMPRQPAMESALAGGCETGKVGVNGLPTTFFCRTIRGLQGSLNAAESTQKLHLTIAVNQQASLLLLSETQPCQNQSQPSLRATKMGDARFASEDEAL